VGGVRCLVNKMTTKFASLTVNARLQPVLVIDPGSHLAIGRIIQGLKQMRTGLWPRHEGDTTLVVTASAGKEAELYKLAWSLPGRGYQLEETPQHKGLDQALAQRKQEIQARVAQAAIPPMAFANKRFSFRPHPRGWRVTFATQSSFISWAKGHEIPFTNLGKHHAIIAHLPQGITPKYDRTPKSTWVQPPIPTPDPEPTPEPTPDPVPDASWTRDQIKEWCESRNLDTTGLRRKAELLELVNSI